MAAPGGPGGPGVVHISSYGFHLLCELGSKSLAEIRDRRRGGVRGAGERRKVETAFSIKE